MNDDPREVLAILNSLGFVGITAQQLKAFMKDLKLYRKVKEHERQQRKEEIKRKIIEKQQNIIKEVLREHRQQFHSTENSISTGSSNSYIDNSLVKVQVKCISTDKENTKCSHSENSHTSIKEKLNSITPKLKKIPDLSNVRRTNGPYESENDKYHLKSRHEFHECLKKDSDTTRKHRTKAESDTVVPKEKPVTPHPIRPVSAPNILEHNQEHIRSSQTRSTSSARNSQAGSKSFIRPWRLQPEAQKALNVKKSDPVTLYQKYQQEWKQMSFPGEAKHSSLRWAIREKMLGGDPHPMPLPRKSASMPTLKKK